MINIMFNNELQYSYTYHDLNMFYNLLPITKTID
jgi:hypothetical protein